jgi:predicted acetyltransferase
VTGVDAPSARLAEPGAAQHRSFLLALTEYHREGLHTDLDDRALSDAAVFARWVHDQREAGQTGSSPLARDRVPHRVLWWVEGPEYLGRLRLNLVLTEELRAFGGHIGYDVRPSARGRGHARAMLAAALVTARSHGIAEALLTCAEDNHASRTVIERNGGRFLDVSSAGRLRYLCPTG